MKQRFRNSLVVFGFLFLTGLFIEQAHGAVYTVTNTNNVGAGSLRQAVLTANSTGADDTVQFTATLRGTTITLSSEIMLGAVGAGTLIIDGLGADVLTIDGGPGDNRIFQTVGTVTIRGVTLQNGGGPGFNAIGAAIRGNFGTIALDSIVVKNNQSISNGVIFFQLGSGHSITNSTISNNSALVCAGFRIDRTSVTISNTTVSGNSTTSFTGGGGCIFDDATVNIYNSTIAGNTAGASGTGGGLNIAGGSGPSRVTLSNTIVAGNSAPANPDIDLSNDGSVIQTQGGNIIGNNASVAGIFPNGNPNGNLDKVGVAALLGPLGNYGGTTPTRQLLSGSPALDAGLSLAQTPVTDQRGAARSGAVDAGAFEANAVYSAILPAGIVSVAYNTTLVPNDCGFTYIQTGGTLPPGLALTASFAPSAVISLAGTPTLSGTYNFQVTATSGANSSITNYAVTVALAPSAASVSVAGQVIRPDGLGLQDATVKLIDGSGNSRTVITNPFGYFSFGDVEAGQTYVISITAKRYRFTPQSIFVGDDITDLSFVAQ